MTRLRVSATIKTVITFQHLAQIKVVSTLIYSVIRTFNINNIQLCLKFLSAPAHTFSTLKNPLIYFKFLGGILTPSSNTNT